MSKDRRYYTRFVINLNSIIYLGNAEIDEIECMVINISEAGACFELDSQYKEIFQVGQLFKFSLYDNSMKQVGLDTELIIGQAIIRRIEDKDTTIQLGCVVHSKELVDYIRHKIVFYNLKDSSE